MGKNRKNNKETSDTFNNSHIVIIQRDDLFNQKYDQGIIINEEYNARSIILGQYLNFFKKQQKNILIMYSINNKIIKNPKLKEQFKKINQGKRSNIRDPYISKLNYDELSLIFQFCWCRCQIKFSLRVWKINKIIAEKANFLYENILFFDAIDFVSCDNDKVLPIKLVHQIIYCDDKKLDLYCEQKSPKQHKCNNVKSLTPFIIEVYGKLVDAAKIDKITENLHQQNNNNAVHSSRIFSKKQLLFFCKNNNISMNDDYLYMPCRNRNFYTQRTKPIINVESLHIF